MAIAAVVWLAYEFWRLLWEPAPRGPMDLRYRRAAVQEWFAGRAVYQDLAFVLDPPATHVLLWPLLGWLDLRPVQWLWAITSLAAVGWTSWLMVREGGASPPALRRVVALLPFSIYATGATIGNGQVGVHLLPLLMAACLLLRERPRTLRVDLTASALFLGALVKPTLSAPFFWIVLFVPATWRPAMFVTAGYLGLTALAAWFQPADVITLLRESTARGAAMGVRPVAGNVANLHVWMGALGVEAWMLPASLFVLCALGVWTYRHRRVDMWLLLGVTGYIARFWSYHRWYDDVLILLPMVALLRVARSGEGRGHADVIAGVLLALTIGASLAPGGLFLFPPPLNRWYVAGQVLVWTAGLLFLLRQASLDRRSSAMVPGARLQSNVAGS